MISVLDIALGEFEWDVSARCFENELIMETAGANGQVIKFFAPSSIENEGRIEHKHFVPRPKSNVYQTCDREKL